MSRSFAVATTVCLSYKQLSTAAPAQRHCFAAAVAWICTLNSNKGFIAVTVVPVTLQIAAMMGNQ
jgi:hypothetical protein